jgi:hypothetical protein
LPIAPDLNDGTGRREGVTKRHPSEADAADLVAAENVGGARPPNSSDIGDLSVPMCAAEMMLAAPRAKLRVRRS